MRVFVPDDVEYVAFFVAPDEVFASTKIAPVLLTDAKSVMLEVTLFSILLYDNAIPTDMLMPAPPPPIAPASDAPTVEESIWEPSVANTDIPLALIPPALAIVPVPSSVALIAVRE